jgi:hypothetical protein
MTAHDAASFLQFCIERLKGVPVHACEEGAARDDAADGTASLGTVALLPHQVEGARRLQQLLDRHGGALLADEVGTGKTFTALRVARDAGPALVVAPAALRDMWQDACHRADVAADVVSYERLSAGRPLPPARWSTVILDEAHHARSPATRRYRALATLTRGARVLLLTATPIHNRRRDLRALFALFLGASAHTLDDASVGALVVRRRVDEVARPFPSLARVERHPVPRADDVLLALRSLPPPLPPSDGGVAQALVALQLTRAWCSSDAALLTAIRRRLVAAAALEQSLEAGRLPSRRDLASWTADIDGSVQLAFPELVAAPAGVPSIARALADVRAHASALRALRAMVRGEHGRDGARFATLSRVLTACAGRQVVVFTHSAETAEAVFAALRARFRLALLSGRGASFASGPVTRREVLAAFAPERHASHAPAHHLDPRRIDVLIATDVLSEGVDLQRAAVVVHLDLPWTVARMEQRMGRLRRMGSPHAQVEAHLIAPPLGAAELEATLVHLVHKARIAGALLGASSVLGDARHWSEILPSTDGPAIAGAREAQIAALRALASHARTAHRPRTERAAPGRSQPSPAPHSRCPANDAQLAPMAEDIRTTPDPHHSRDMVALAESPLRLRLARRARWPLSALREPITLALISLDGNTQLVVATARELTADPITVVRALTRLLEHDREAPHAPGPPPDSSTACHCTCSPFCAGSATDSDLLDTLASPSEQRVLDWCVAREAALQVVPPAAQDSSSHRRLLHALDAIPIRAPRARRSSVSRVATDARRLALAQHGVGAERLLDDLANARPARSDDFEQHDRWLDRVVATLRGAPPRHQGADTCAGGDGSESSRARVILEGMLTLLPAPDLP